MTITLPPDQEAWLQARVADGEFPSVEAAARQLLAERIAELDGGDDESDDRLWAKPYIDQGIASLDRGEYVTLEEHKSHLAALLASLKR